MFTKAYIEQLRSLHKDKSRPQGFGGKVKDLGAFHSYMEKWQPKSLLDYGCGKGAILLNLTQRYPNTKCVGYDPAVPEFNKLLGQKFECVFSNDVLEHIEPNFIVDVLTHINVTATKYIWLRIDTLPARKSLPDGRNAHLILESDNWWHNMIEQSIEGEIVYSKLDKKGKFDVAITK